MKMKKARRSSGGYGRGHGRRCKQFAGCIDMEMEMVLGLLESRFGFRSWLRGEAQRRQSLQGLCFPTLNFFHGPVACQKCKLLFWSKTKSMGKDSSYLHWGKFQMYL